MPILKNSEWDLAFSALQKLSTKDFPAAGACRIKQLIKHIGEHVKILYDTRNTLLEKYALKDSNDNVVTKESGEVVFPSISAEREYYKEFNDMMMDTWDYPYTLRPKDIGIGTPYEERCEISPQLLLMLGDLLEEIPMD